MLIRIAVDAGDGNKGRFWFNKTNSVNVRCLNYCDQLFLFFFSFSVISPYLIICIFSPFMLASVMVLSHF